MRENDPTPEDDAGEQRAPAADSDGSAARSARDGVDREDQADRGEGHEPGQEPPEDETDGEWRYSLADLEDEPEPAPLEAGSPEPEHVVFVLLGVALTIAVIYRLVVLVGATVG